MRGGERWGGVNAALVENRLGLGDERVGQAGSCQARQGRSRGAGVCSGLTGRGEAVRTSQVKAAGTTIRAMQAGAAHYILDITKLQADSCNGCPFPPGMCTPTVGCHRRFSGWPPCPSRLSACALSPSPHPWSALHCPSWVAALTKRASGCAGRIGTKAPGGKVGASTANLQRWGQFMSTGGDRRSLN